MMGYWLLFASLTVLGSLVYNVTMKAGGVNANAFSFTLILGFALFLTQLLALLVAKYGFNVDVGKGINAQSVTYGLICGASVTLINIAYFLALRYGTPIQCQTFWTVGGTIALAIFSILFFKESVTPIKALGLLLGVASLFMIVRG